jgi:hypothetical protein
MKQFLILLFLGAVACAQTAVQTTAQTESASFSAIGVSSVAAPGLVEETQTQVKSVNSLPELLPQPKGKPTLTGGTIAKVDRVHNELTINIFGGGRARILFDGRTHIERNGAGASENDLQNGERVYLDTMRAGNNVFASSIRVAARGATGQVRGQVLSYNSRTGELLLNDAASPQRVKLHIVSATTFFSREHQAASGNDLKPGALVSAEFLGNDAGQVVAREISILAGPGDRFVFVGRVAQLDIHTGLIVLIDPRDHKSYEVNFDPNALSLSDDLREGAIVEATTDFDGHRYVANAIRVDSKPTP